MCVVLEITFFSGGLLFGSIIYTLQEIRSVPLISYSMTIEIKLVD